MPFQTSIELLITPERFINVDLTKKGTYKIQIIFPECVTKGKLIPSFINLENKFQDESLEQSFESSKEKNLQLSQNFLYQFSQKKSFESNKKNLFSKNLDYAYGPSVVRFRQERYPTQLAYHSSAQIETLYGVSSISSNYVPNNKIIQNEKNKNQDIKVVIVDNNDSLLVQNDFKNKEDQRQFVRFVNNHPHRNSVYLPESLLNTGANYNFTTNHKYKILRYTSNHFNIIYRDQEKTFQDNIQLFIDIPDILDWIQKDTKLEITFNLLLYKDMNQFSSDSQSDLIEEEQLKNLEDDSMWISILSNSIKIHRIWEGVNCVHPVSFNDGRNFSVLWAGFHACLTKINYSISENEIMKINVNDKIIKERKSFTNVSQESYSLMQSNSQQSLKRNSIRNQIISRYSIQKHEFNVESLEESYISEFIMQKYEKDFFAYFVPYVVDNMQQLWNSSHMTFYSMISQIITICTNFTRFMARNWIVMDDKLKTIYQLNNISQSFSSIPGTPEKLKQNPINFRNKEDNLVEESVFPETIPKRRNSQPPSPTNFKNLSSLFCNYNINEINDTKLWIPKTHQFLGEKWVQQLEDLFKKRAERPWMLPFVINEIFKSPFELDMKLRWGRVIEMCSKSLGTIHMDLKNQFIENLNINWKQYLGLDIENQENILLNEIQITDSLFNSLRKTNDKFNSEQFSIQIIENSKLNNLNFNILTPNSKKRLNIACENLGENPLFSPQFSKYIVDNASSSFKHLIVFVPGYKGSHHDFRLMRFLLELQLHPSSCRYFLFEPDSELYHSLTIQEMSISFAQKLSEYIKSRNLHFEKVSFIAHSLGGVIVRSMLQPGTQSNIIFKDIFPRSSLHLFCSMGSPHLGSFKLKSKLVSTAIYLMSSVQKIKCLQSLSYSDCPDSTKTWLYELNSNIAKNHIKHFKHVILCGSHQDTYVNYNSSIIHFDDEYIDNLPISKDILKQWVQDFNNCVNQSNVIRMNIKFAKTMRNSSYQETFEKFTGKFFHISYLLDSDFLNSLISLYLRELFED